MKPPREIPFEITGSQGLPIRGDVRLPPEATGRPLLVICHGFKGFKDWGFFPHISRSLAAAGFPNAIFNFSHGGVGEDGETFTRLDLFRKNTWGKEIFDLRAVMEAASEGRLPGSESYDGGAFFLLGHSRGGGVVLLAAASDPRVRRVATIASIARADRFSDEVKRKWRREGVITIWNMRTRQEMPMDIDFLEDIEGRPGAYSIEDAVRSLRIPQLVLHGEKDESVPVAEGIEIASWAAEDRVKKAILPDCDHVLNSRHPFPGTNPTLDEAMTIVADFLG